MSDLKLHRRYIKNDEAAVLPKADPELELVKSLAKLVDEFGPNDDKSSRDFKGLFCGPTSVAYLFLCLSKVLPNLMIRDCSPQHWCDRYLSIGNRHDLAGHRSSPDECGVVSEQLAYWAVSAARSNGMHQEIDKFIAEIPNLNSIQGSDEWLYGRAGTLYMLRLVKHYVSESNSRIDPVINDLLTCIISNEPHWEWQNSEWYGAGHGTIGIITQLVLSKPSCAKHVEPILKALLERQLSDGNWPSSPSGSHELIQFCHGAPGFVISLRALRPHFPSLEHQIDSAMTKARDLIWEKGLLRKEPNLCHGITGNAIALEGGKHDIFMRWTAKSVIDAGIAEGIFYQGDDPHGLFWGEAGRAWGWLTMLVGEDRGMIGYNDV
ncbi:hypothetical protein MMC09_001744 [Bachmanniomyces sp. S44760]|nr:hypothetical protein [Bachmanniomyces sp. S44760]